MYTNIMKHNRLNKYDEEFDDIFISNISTDYFVAIDKIDAKPNHVEIMLIFFFHKQIESF